MALFAFRMWCSHHRYPFPELFHHPQTYPLSSDPPLHLPPTQSLNNLHSKLTFCFLGPHPWHMEVSRLGVELELQLPTYTTATATWELSHICDLHHSSQQHRILNPPSKARDRTCDLMVPSWICFHHDRNSQSLSLDWSQEAFTSTATSHGWFWTGLWEVGLHKTGISPSSQGVRGHHDCWTFPLNTQSILLFIWEYSLTVHCTCTAESTTSRSFMLGGTGPWALSPYPIPMGDKGCTYLQLK